MKDPLKQGLKLFAIKTSSLILFVEVKDPLKQGLKHHLARVRHKYNLYVEVKDPLKQGLKHSVLNFRFSGYRRLK